MDSLLKLSVYFEMINPIMIFMLVLSAFLLLMYLKRKLDVFFTQLTHLSADIKRIADNTELNQ